MSLHIKNITKFYGQQKAVDDISFSVDQGAIVGFLGPNGAGKSTTMKMVTGYLAPSEGKINVGGFDVLENPIEVKRIIGYLPEHNPLYLDMYVHEYLLFAGKLSGIAGSRLKHRVAEIIDLCGIVPEQNKKLEALSKGYRQRVGLAQSLLHDPEVLILDEPTSGLDPNQILEIRKVIKEISRNKTVLFSTHIMQEVQALCNRVVIINKGRLVADDQLSNLLKNKGGNSVVVEFQEEIDIEGLRNLAGVADVIAINKNKYRVTSLPDVDLRSQLFRFATEKDLSLIELKVEEYSIESLFKELTVQDNGI